VRCTRAFSLGITGEGDYPAGRIYRRRQALETGVILPELAASQVRQISIEPAQRVA
jgi:hypothetical protein